MSWPQLPTFRPNQPLDDYGIEGKKEIYHRRPFHIKKNPCLTPRAYNVCSRCRQAGNDDARLSSLTAYPNRRVTMILQSLLMLCWARGTSPVATVGLLVLPYAREPPERTAAPWQQQIIPPSVWSVPSSTI